MGAIVSLPISMASTFAMSCLGGCCSNLFSNMAATLGSSSLGTRLLYAIWLLLNSLLSWISLSANKAFLFPGRSCSATGECGFFTVHRLNFALGIFHLVLAGSLLNVKTTKDIRATLQNSWWTLKFLAYIVLVIVSFLIPNNFYVFFSKWVSVPSGAVFILVGLILLVDFAHEWAETCVYHVELEDENSNMWKNFLVAGTAIMYTSAIVMTIAMYYFFCHDNCNMNKASVTINIILTLLTLAISIHPKVQQANPKSGLAQSSMVAFYCTYLTMSAMASEPDDRMCNPLVRTNGTRKASVILGSIFTFVAIAYTTTRAAANSAFQGSNNSGPIYLPDELEYDGLEGQTRNQLRYEAIKQAVEEGSLPESALYDNSWLGATPTMTANRDLGLDVNDDEVNGTQYNYSLFHIIFFLATQWIAILLTINVTHDDVGDFVPVGRTYFYSWVKIISAWICYGLYGWTVVAPVLMPYRFDFEDYY
ncbi:Membrane protein TMS1 [Nakaseomyces bracarensis]|uniref:Membrane protein TMS1 n=1 Tax=Nakaseomyces bracarensis TaxID=273131 RepID=A0ABR4P068_9SACH